MDEILRMLQEAGIQFSYDEPGFTHLYRRNRLASRDALAGRIIEGARQAVTRGGLDVDEETLQTVAQEEADRRVLEDSVNQYLEQTGRLGPVLRQRISARTAERLRTDESLTPEGRQALQAQLPRLAKMGVQETRRVEEEYGPSGERLGRAGLTGLTTGAAQIPALLARPLPGVTAEEVMLGAEDIAGLPGGVQTPGEAAAEFAGFGASTLLPGAAGASIAGRLAPQLQRAKGVFGVSPAAEGLSAGIRAIPRGAAEGLGYAAVGTPEATVESFEQGGLPGGLANLLLQAGAGAAGSAVLRGVQRGTDVAALQRPGGIESLLRRGGAEVSPRQGRLFDLLESDPTYRETQEGLVTKELTEPPVPLSTGPEVSLESPTFLRRQPAPIAPTVPEAPIPTGTPDPLSALEQQLSRVKESALQRQELLAGEDIQEFARTTGRLLEQEPGTTAPTLEQTTDILKRIEQLTSVLKNLREARGEAPAQGARFRAADYLVSQSRGGQGRKKKRT